MSNITSKDPIAATKVFRLNGKVISCEPYGNGHINATYLVVTQDDNDCKHSYILQAVNQNAFKEPENVISNIQKVIAFLRKANDDERQVVSIIPTVDDEYFYRCDNGDFWRVYTFVEDSICIERPDNTEDFRQCGIAFGRFQRDLDDFPAEELFETIADFHNTPKRYQTFLKALNDDVCNRAASVKDEIDFIKQRADFYSVLFDANKQGILPLRVTHNDTKSNNVLLDKATHNALCVIDLDTIMPGFSVTDVGDAIRFGASTAAEDEKDLSKVNFDIKMFEAFCEGFIKGSGGLLSAEEIMLIPEGSKMMTIECGMRFLTDYLSGDTYFKISYPEHNLDRCRTHIKLVSDMENSWEEMKGTLKKYI